MNIENSLLEIGKSFQNFLEEKTENFPSGTCYLSAFCLSEYFKSIGYKSDCVA